MKTSLEKSHSKFSNFKLTMLAMFELISFQGFWLTLALKNHLSNPLFGILFCTLILIFVISLIMMRKFKR